MKTGRSKKKEHSRKIKAFRRAICITKDKCCDLYIEMLSYNLTEAKIGRTQKCLFFLKTNFFKIHSEQKLSTKRVDSFSCNYLKSSCDCYQ